MPRNGIASLILIGMIGVSLGCSGPKQVAVQGEVTFDGQPVEEGSIVFLPEPGTESRKAAAAILKGKYQIPPEIGPSPGKFRIEISWMQKTGKTVASADPGMTVEEAKEVIPAQYNTASTLIRDVTTGNNRLDFELSR